MISDSTVVGPTPIATGKRSVGTSRQRPCPPELNLQRALSPVLPQVTDPDAAEKQERDRHDEGEVAAPGRPSYQDGLSGRSGSYQHGYVAPTWKLSTIACCAARSVERLAIVS